MFAATEERGNRMRAEVTEPATVTARTISPLPGRRCAEIYWASGKRLGSDPEAISTGAGKSIGRGATQADSDGQRSLASSTGAGVWVPAPGSIAIPRLEIGSIKGFRGADLAVMVNAGEVSLDDPAARFLPPGHRMLTRGGSSIDLHSIARATADG